MFSLKEIQNSMCDCPEFSTAPHDWLILRRLFLILAPPHWQLFLIIAPPHPSTPPHVSGSKLFSLLSGEKNKQKDTRKNEAMGSQRLVCIIPAITQY